MKVGDLVQSVGDCGLMQDIEALYDYDGEKLIRTLDGDPGIVVEYDPYYLYKQVPYIYAKVLFSVGTGIYLAEDMEDMRAVFRVVE